MTSRRDALRNLLKGLPALGSGGLLWSAGANGAKANKLVLRPPGALGENHFQAACVKCGQCVEACQYDTLKLNKPASGALTGTPYFEPRKVACKLCPDIPCADVCPSGALDIKSLKNEDGQLDVNVSRMGLAVIHEESCIAYWGIRCDACYRSCPLIDKAIVLKYELNEVTHKHGNLLPIVQGDVCTGCGICEQVCVVEKAAIKVLPKAVAEGKVGEHYIKGWDTQDESRIRTDQQRRATDEDVESALDYLNSDDNLLDNE